jgi:hypothetical protein
MGKSGILNVDRAQRCQLAHTAHHRVEVSIETPVGGEINNVPQAEVKLAMISINLRMSEMKL